MTDILSAKKPYVRPKCPHGRDSFYCKECNGSGFCERCKRKNLLQNNVMVLKYVIMVNKKLNVKNARVLIYVIIIG